MGKGNKERIGVEVPDRAMPADQLREILELRGEPPAGLPVAGNPETRQAEGEKLERHIRSIVEKFDFLDCLKKDKRELSDEQGEKIEALIWKGKETIIQQIISYLFGEYGEESVKNLISKNTFPELELFEDELHDIAVSYYDTISETGKKSAKAASADTEGANLEKYPDGVLDGAAEALSKFAEQEELEKEIETAVETRIQEILKAINNLDRENLQKSGVDLRKLDEELKEIQKEGKAKIIKHCLNSFQAGGALKTKIRDREKIKFWTDYYTESFFEYRGGDDLRAAYLKAFPERSKVFREVFRDKKVEPAEIIPGSPKPKEEEITIERILASEELKEIYAAIEEYLLDELQKIREADKQRVNLTEDERAVLEEFLQGQYEEKFIPDGSPDNEEAKKIFTETIIQSIESKLERK